MRDLVRFLISIVFCVASSNLSAREFHWKGFLKRTEYSNEALLSGVNYNVWIYRIVSLGQSWDGPENSIYEIKTRAMRSSEDAQELLLLMSKALKQKNIAGDHVLDLYQFLLLFSQNKKPMPVSVFRELMETLDLYKEVYYPFWGADERPIVNQFVQFIVTDLKFPLQNLESQEDKRLALYLAKIVLLAGDFVLGSVFNDLIQMVMKEDDLHYRMTFLQMLELDSSHLLRIYSSQHGMSHSFFYEYLNAKRLLLNSLDKRDGMRYSKNKIESYRSQLSGESLVRVETLLPYIELIHQYGGEGDEMDSELLEYNLRNMARDYQREKSDLPAALHSLVTQAGY